MPEDWIAIVNRRAGGFGRREAEIVEQLKRIVAEVAWTEHSEHAAELAAASHSYRGIIVVGGDGTVFQVLQGMDPAAQRLAIVPAGRGNSLARDLGLRANVPDFSFEKAPDLIDLMEVAFDTAAGWQRCLAASTVAVGYPVQVAQRADCLFRFLRGQCYSVAAVVTRPARFYSSVLYDGTRFSQGRLTGLIVNNTRHVANFLAFPQADCRDGLVDVMQLDQGFLGQTLHNISALEPRFPYRPPSPIAATRVRLETSEPMMLLVDGEMHWMRSRMEVRLLAGLLASQTA